MQISSCSRQPLISRSRRHRRRDDRRRIGKARIRRSRHGRDQISHGVVSAGALELSATGPSQRRTTSWTARPRSGFSPCTRRLGRTSGRGRRPGSPVIVMVDVVGQKEFPSRRTSRTSRTKGPRPFVAPRSGWRPRQYPTRALSHRCCWVSTLPLRPRGFSRSDKSVVTSAHSDSPCALTALTL